MTEQKPEVEKAPSQEVTITDLLNAGVHFGHRTMKRNPKMSRYIHTSRNGISIINLDETKKKLRTTLSLIKEIAKNNGKILFVATKRQASAIVADSAKRCGQYYVNFKWLGGMLTNWGTVSKSIETLKSIELQLAEAESDLKKKERLMLERKRQKLEISLGGIKDMNTKPDLVFVIDTNRESIAVLEANKLGIPVVAILDTNCDPAGITYPIPGNDDSAKSIRLFCHLIADAIIAGTSERAVSGGISAKVASKDQKPHHGKDRDAGSDKHFRPGKKRTEFKSSDNDTRKFAKPNKPAVTK